MKSTTMYRVGKITPVVKIRGNELKLFLHEEMTNPILAYSSRSVEVVGKALSKRFLARNNPDGSRDILLPITAFPAVSVWLAASYGARPSEELLEKLLDATPKAVADVIWKKIESSPGVVEDWTQPLMDAATLRETAKTIRRYLKIHGVT
ncbi:hypothetical protein [Desulfurococcus mucosus]|uniref:Uncharacterized protein n=1 Tax=Desulfurococcus mucosus (strain ATCC 35584 / DSM 2162 / JCM 9187 / O7/1) TaxID=765177 RepID=E8R7C0_DESM0|nr:hypothetical protein [Desulfurococcus mucosus]ADV65585.1 hypothetical protein Desmu_1290 [Desulfurococcus mucosus DSM 2162]